MKRSRSFYTMKLVVPQIAFNVHTQSTGVVDWEFIGKYANSLYVLFSSWKILPRDVGTFCRLFLEILNTHKCCDLSWNLFPVEAMSCMFRPKQH